MQYSRYGRIVRKEARRQSDRPRAMRHGASGTVVANASCAKRRPHAGNQDAKFWFLVVRGHKHWLSGLGIGESRSRTACGHLCNIYGPPLDGDSIDIELMNVPRPLKIDSL